MNFLILDKHSNNVIKDRWVGTYEKNKETNVFAVCSLLFYTNNHDFFSKKGDKQEGTLSLRAETNTYEDEANFLSP